MAELKRRVELICLEFEASVVTPVSGQYLDRRRQLDALARLARACADLARAAHCEEVRAAVAQRQQPRRRLASV